MASEKRAAAPDAVDDFDDSEALPIACAHCHEPMPPGEDLCDRCGYHRVLKRVIDLEGIHRQDSSTGLERTLRRHLHDPESTGDTLMWAKVVAGFFVVLILYLCLGWLWWIGVLLAGGGLAWYFWRAGQRAQGEEGDFNRDPVVSLVWGSLLGVQRAAGWRQLGWPFARCITLILRDPKFGDEDLADLENIRDFQAIDVEGTNVSDAGLVYLEEASQLQFLVLRRTRVTEEAVCRLQTVLSDTWIWS